MKSLLLVDLSGIFWANWHASEGQEVSAAQELTLGKVVQLRQGYDLVAICCDCPPYKRKALLPAYKAQRDAPPPQAVEQLRRVKRRLEIDGLLVWEFAGYEADDLIATAVMLAKGEEAPLEITIASSDKDLMQLVDDSARVRVLSPMSGAILDARLVAEKLGVPPQLVRDFLSLTGDASDNVPGVPGVGPKNAAKLLEQFGTLEGVLEGAGTVQQPKLKENLLASADAARLAYSLIGLYTDVPLDFDAVFAERTPGPLVQADAARLDVDEDPAEPPPEAIATPAPPMAAISRPVAQNQNMPAPSWDLALQPRSLGAADALGKALFNSRLYAKFPNAEAITAILLRGREMGLAALTSLDVFHVIEGKPVLSAHLMLARAKAHPDCEWFCYVSGDSEYAEYETKNRRNPSPTRIRYTIEDAKVAGLCPQNPRQRNPSPGERDRRGNWEKRPAEMLRKTAAVQLARIEYPEAILGLYAIEEFSE